MSTDDGIKSVGNGFAKPGWVIAAAGIGLLVVVGIVVSVVSVNRGADSTSSGTGAGDSLTDTNEVSAGEGDSTCGLNEVELSGTLDRSPVITWANIGTVSYPVSEQYGAGEINADGIATCFSRTPQGAALAAATGMAFSFSPDHVKAWREYAIVPGEARELLLAAEPNTSVNLSSYRIRSQAVNLLSYDGTNAVVDVGISIASDGGTRYIGAMTPLVWQDSDWRVNYTVEQLSDDFAQLPSLSGYIHWSEQ